MSGLQNRKIEKFNESLFFLKKSIKLTSQFRQTDQKMKREKIQITKVSNDPIESKRFNRDTMNNFMPTN